MKFIYEWYKANINSWRLKYIHSMDNVCPISSFKPCEYIPIFIDSWHLYTQMDTLLTSYGHHVSHMWYPYGGHVMLSC